MEHQEYLNWAQRAAVLNQPEPEDPLYASPFVSSYRNSILKSEWTKDSLSKLKEIIFA